MFFALWASAFRCGKDPVAPGRRTLHPACLLSASHFVVCCLHHTLLGEEVLGGRCRSAAAALWLVMYRSALNLMSRCGGVRRLPPVGVSWVRMSFDACQVGALLP